MTRQRSFARLCLVAAAMLMLALNAPAGLAAGDEPKPKPPPDPKSTTKPKPKDGVRDDEIYSLGYWQAKGGQYATALETLRSAGNQRDPRIQTMIGFSLRKLGRVEEAMGHYHAVLAAHPERTTTRQYLGEAYLQIGQPAKAQEQLSEIAKRCGQACDDYQLLADAIAKSAKPAG